MVPPLKLYGRIQVYLADQRDELMYPKSMFFAEATFQECQRAAQAFLPKILMICLAAKGLTPETRYVSSNYLQVSTTRRRKRGALPNYKRATKTPNIFEWSIYPRFSFPFEFFEILDFLSSKILNANPDTYPTEIVK